MVPNVGHQGMLDDVTTMQQYQDFITELWFELKNRHKKEAQCASSFG
jgi:hypothetical protein